jgi:UDPglucose 6-dehydrogenase
MKIGIIGLGVVGSACQKGFEILGHEVYHSDPKFGTSIEDVLESEIVFVCVPTWAASDGSCDISLIRNTVEALTNHSYTGVIAIKSTVLPGTTQNLIKTYNNDRICFVPEFLHEVSAVEDFVSNHDLLAVGCVSDYCYNTVLKACGWFPKKHVQLDPTEAEILKYYANTFNALRVVFANVFYEICNKFNVDYNQILQAFLMRSSHTYLECNQNLRGYGGQCLPKDVNAMREFCKQLNFDFDLFECIDHDNSLVKTTIPSGMRPYENH